jgi:hypothetical protein
MTGVLRMVRVIAIAGAMLAPRFASAQQPASPPPVKPASPLAPRTWVVAGAGYAAARAGCTTCDQGVVTQSYPILVDAGVRVTPRVDAGVELYWVRLKVNAEKPIQTTFVLGVVQMRPWVERGLFVRAGMGIGIAGNGLYNPNGPPLAPPYTTNALAIAFGVGWEHRINRRWAVQAHALQHVAALGELTTEAGERIRNVVGNYWTVGFGIVIR